MPENVELFIDQQKIEQFSGFSLNLSIDQLGAGISFNSPFFPEIKKYRDLFRPRKYQDVEAYIGGNKVFKGTMDLVNPLSTNQSNSVNIQCRSKTAIIVDCTFEKSDFPVQFSNAKLDEIVNSVINKFGLTSVFPLGPGALFELAGPKSPTETIFSFLQNLARQRKFLMNQNAAGNLVFDTANSNNTPVANFKEGQQGVTVSDGKYDGTKMFSSFDVFGQERGKTNNHGRIVDPTMEGIIRPKSITANGTNSANIIDSATWAATAAIAAAINIPLSVEGWRRPDGELWAVNEIITLFAPSLMIYKPYNFLIKAATLSDLPSAKTTALTLTIPGAYTGILPEVYPWDE